MKQNNKNKNNNAGCAIAVGGFVLVNIICYFMTSSKQEIAGTGAFLLLTIFLVAAYFGIKVFLHHTEDTDCKIVRIGVPIALFIALMLLFGSIMKDFNTMVVIGSIGFIVFCAIIGILIYNSYKD